MTLSLLFTVLTLALVVGAALLLLLVVFRRERQLTNLALAVLLIVLALGVWWTAIRSPLTIH
ncbi:MAG: hypothetical protein KGJ98_08180 [Chloroflexota bacterium]|nr:hypothetical protein [Chloroflexota bacterium]